MALISRDTSVMKRALELDVSDHYTRLVPLSMCYNKRSYCTFKWRLYCTLPFDIFTFKRLHWI